MPCSLQTLHRLNWYGIKFHTLTHRIMDMERSLTKFEKVLLKVLDKAAYLFLTTMAILMGATAIFTICSGLDFVNIFGFVGLMGAAAGCWEFRK